jgi:hypothetical protein
MSPQHTGSSRYDHALRQDTLRGLGQQRQVARYAFHADVLVLPFDGRERPFWGCTDDLCHRGLFIRSTHQLPIGSLVVIKLFTEMGMLKLTCKIVHRLEQLGFGCEFIDQNSQQEAAISFLISAANSAPPEIRTVCLRAC